MIQAGGDCTPLLLFALCQRRRGTGDQLGQQAFETQGRAVQPDPCWLLTILYFRTFSRSQQPKNVQWTLVKFYLQIAAAF